MKKYIYFLLIGIIFFACEPSIAQSSVSVTKHVTNKVYRLNDLTSRGGVIYRALLQTSNTPPHTDWVNISTTAGSGAGNINDGSVIGSIAIWNGTSWVETNYVNIDGNGDFNITEDLIVVGAITGSNLSGDNNGDQVAATTPFTPAGNIEATNVQDAIEELESEVTVVETDPIYVGDEITIVKTDEPRTVTSRVTFDGVTGVPLVNALSGEISALGDLAVPNARWVLDNISTGGGLSGFENLTTGVLTGGEVTINADPTKFDVAAGTGVIIDWTAQGSPVRTNVIWGAFTAESVPNLATGLFSSVAINAAGQLLKTSGIPVTPELRRTTIRLQVVVHTSGVAIDRISGSSKPAYDHSEAMLDYISKLGAINSGNSYSANGANLQLDKTSGETTDPFNNRALNHMSPTTVTNAAQTGLSFNSIYQDGGSGFTITPGLLNIDSANWDDGSGTLQAVPNNQWTIQRIYFFSGAEVTGVSYGQAIYSSSAEAEIHIFNEQPNLSPIFNLGTFVGALLVKQGATDLSDLNQGEFITISLGGAGGSSGGSDDPNAWKTSGTTVITDPTLMGDVNFDGTMDVTGESHFAGKLYADGQDVPWEANLVATLDYLYLNYEPLTEQGYAGENFANGSIVYQGAGNQWWKADADVLDHVNGRLAFATAEGLTGQLFGVTDKIEQIGTGYTAGDHIYLSNTAGTFQTTLPTTGYARIIGMEKSTTNRHFVLEAINYVAVDGSNVNGVTFQTGGLTVEVDPIYVASQAVFITAQHIIDLNNLSNVNTGDQDISGIATNASAITILENANTGDQDAAGVPFTPAGATTSDNVQAAIEEIQTELNGVGSGTVGGTGVVEQIALWNGTSSIGGDTRFRLTSTHLYVDESIEVTNGNLYVKQEDSYLGLDSGNTHPRFGMMKKSGYAGMFASSNTADFIIGQTDSGSINPADATAITTQFIINSGNGDIEAPTMSIADIESNGSGRVMTTREYVEQFKGVRPELIAAPYTTVTADNGKHIVMSTSDDVTLDDAGVTVNDQFHIFNISGGDISFAFGTGDGAYQGSLPVLGDGLYAWCTLTATNTWSVIIGGAGGGSGGSSTLSGLDDTDITSPTNAQALVYNSSAGKWENSTLAGGGDMTKTTYDTNADDVVDDAEDSQLLNGFSDYPRLAVDNILTGSNYFKNVVTNFGNTGINESIAVNIVDGLGVPRYLMSGGGTGAAMTGNPGITLTTISTQLEYNGIDPTDDKGIGDQGYNDSRYVAKFSDNKALDIHDGKWTYGSGWSNGADKIVGSNAFGNLQYSDGGIQIGESLEITFVVENYVSGWLQVKAGQYENAVGLDNIQGNGTYTYWVEAATYSEGSFTFLIDGYVNFYGDITDVRVRKLGLGYDSSYAVQGFGQSNGIIINKEAQGVYGISGEHLVGRAGFNKNAAGAHTLYGGYVGGEYSSWTSNTATVTAQIWSFADWGSSRGASASKIIQQGSQKILFSGSNQGITIRSKLGALVQTTGQWAIVDIIWLGTHEVLISGDIEVQ